MDDTARADLLVELGCEELPPGTLQQLALAFFDSTSKQLRSAGLEFDASESRVFYTPRRLAFRLAGVAGRQPDQVQDRKGPSVEAAFDGKGNPTKAAEGFARSVGRKVEELERQKTDKGEWLFCQVHTPGQALSELLFPILEQALSSLPVAKPMRWSDHPWQFVRPVHWLVVLHGSRVIEGRLFGISASNETRGHRIHSPGPHSLASADRYEAVLNEACVQVDAVLRKQQIRKAVEQAANHAGQHARITEALLEEVNNIVEWPVAVACEFDEAFLEVPPEALIASMEDHQKFFPVTKGDEDALTSRFIAVANLQSHDVDAVRGGFERVIRPRLADARFFWEQDGQQPLEGFVSRLDDIMFQRNLGSVGDKSRRLESFSAKIGDVSGTGSGQVARAARLCKCDLLTQMVGEFPSLQGIMGAYYASASGESQEVATAIREHYSPRHAGDQIPASPDGRLLSLADRLDTLLGIFATGNKPSGNKDPFALRRAALGAARIMLEAPLPVALDDLFASAAESLRAQLDVTDSHVDEARAFLVERVRHHFLDQGAPARLVNAALAAPLTSLPDLGARLDALVAFMEQPEAEELVAANKRIGNILSSQGADFTGEIDQDRFVLNEERALFDEVCTMEAAVLPRFDKGEYTEALASLAGLNSAIAPFFDAVMVMDEDPVARNNRLSLLARLKRLFDRVADLSLAG